MTDSILELLRDGPVPTRKLLRNRKGAFRLAYAKLLREGAIVESGSGRKMDPKYTGLPGATFPGRRRGVNPADVVLLMLAGATEDEAHTRLKTAFATGGLDAVTSACEEAEQVLLDRGLVPYNEIRRAVNRRVKGKSLVAEERRDFVLREGQTKLSSVTD